MRAKRKAALALLLVILFLPLSSFSEERIVDPLSPSPDYVEWLLDIARAEIGYTEEKSGYTKYGAWAGNPYAEWCAEFVCWCVSQVDEQHGTNLLNTVYPLYSASNTGRNWFIREGRYIARTGTVDGWGSQWFIGETEAIGNGDYVPQPGDWVFYSIDGVNTSHVALIEYCTVDDKGIVTAHTIEGNMPDRVQRNSHLLTDWDVAGYGTVWDLADTVMQSGNTGKKVTAFQEKLAYLGYLDAQYITGTYGPSTVEAVKMLQQDTGKVPTGFANHHTQLTVSELYREKYWQDDANFEVIDSEPEE